MDLVGLKVEDDSYWESFFFFPLLGLNEAAGLVKWMRLSGPLRYQALLGQGIATQKEYELILVFFFLVSFLTRR